MLQLHELDKALCIYATLKLTYGPVRALSMVCGQYPHLEAHFK